MGILFIAINQVTQQIEGMLVKRYGAKHGNGGMLMNAIIALVATVFFVITDTDGFHAPAEMFPLAVINAFLYGAGFYCTFAAFFIAEIILPGFAPK